MPRPFLFFLTLFAFLSLSACSSKAPSNLGIFNQKLSDCPNKPNCVSSYATDTQHAVNAFKTGLSAQQSFDMLLKVLHSQDNCQVVNKQFPYIHATFESNLFGFVDDVEWLVENNAIQVRSASRIGYSDLGVNRKRIERIRAQFNDQLRKESL